MRRLVALKTVPPPSLSDSPEMVETLVRTLQRSEVVTAILEKADAPGAEVVVRDTTEALSRLTGLAREALIGRPWASLYPAEPNTAAIEAMADAFERGAAARTRLYCRRGEAAVAGFWLEAYIVPAESAPKGLRRFVLQARDVTAAHEEAERQRAIEGLLTQVFISVDAAVSIVGLDGRYLMVNPAYDRLLGYRPGALAGRSTAQVIAPADRNAARLARERQELDGQPYRLNLHLLKADGVELPVTLTSTLAPSGGSERVRIDTVIPQLGLKDVAEEGVAVAYRVAGKIRVVGLEGVRVALGGRWAALAERVMTTAEQIIQRRIGPHDAYSRSEDCAFLICFAEISEDEASLRADAIAREVRERLLGAGEPSEAVRIITATASLPPGEPGRSSEVLAEALAAPLAAREAARAAEPEPEPAAPPAPIAFAPVSTRGGERLGAFVTAAAPGEATWAGARAGPEVDLQVLAAAAGWAGGHERGGLVFAPVGFHSFQARAVADAYIRACRQLPLHARQRLVLLVGGLEDGVPEVRALEVMQRLRPLCRSVGLFVADLAAPPPSYAHGKRMFVALDGAAMEEGGEAAFLKMKKSVRVLHAPGVRVLMARLHKPESERRAFALGVELISRGE
jgi:PAS domain S-box-containing protein